MPKVNRNKQHIDYSNLLSELQKKNKPEEKETAPSRQKLQAESKIDFSQRNSMLSNPEIQFAIVINKGKQTLHDKTCKQLREILAMAFRQGFKTKRLLLFGAKKILGR